MWLFVMTAVTLGTARAVRASPALDLDLDLVTDILSELEELPLEERTDDNVSPELVDLYQDIELLFEMQKSNLSESREGRGLLSKLSFLTGLKLGSFLTSSGTLAASQSINFLGKVLNAALSISYGNIGSFGGLFGGLQGGGIEPEVDEPAVGEHTQGLQKLPIIREDVPLDDKKRDKPDETLSIVPRPSSLTTNKVMTPAEAVRKEFLKSHNKRVENFNNAFDKKIKKRTGRTEVPKSDPIT